MDDPLCFVFVAVPTETELVTQAANALIKVEPRAEIVQPGNLVGTKQLKCRSTYI